MTSTNLSLHPVRIGITLLFSIYLFSSNSLNAAIIYVDQSAVGAANGTSWSDAYPDLSAGLQSSSPGDEIWVAAGVYYPSMQVDLDGSGGSDGREATFQIPSGVKVYGGFNGTENIDSERDWITNATILSGDLDMNDENLDGNFIAENTGQINGSNAYHVIYTVNVNDQTQLDGFHITAGSASKALPSGATDPNLDGGAWYNKLDAPTYESSPVLSNLTFSGNYAVSEGGGFYSTPGPAGAKVILPITDCHFEGNEADITAGALYLGSFALGDYQAQILRCNFEDNTAYRRGGAIYLVGDQSAVDTTHFIGNSVTAISPDMSTLPGSGGAVSLVSSGAIFRGSMFAGNSATGNPTGAFEGGGGGAVYISTNDPQTTTFGPIEPAFIGCGFYNNQAGGNTAAWGGAATHLNDAGILNVKYVNCVFDGNEAQNHGGAVANFTRVISGPAGFSPAMNIDFTNCHFTSNSADQLGGGLYNDGYEFMGSEILTVEIVNTLFWDNAALTDGDQVYNTAITDVSYSLIQNSGGSGGGWDTSIGNDGGNNRDANPGLINSADPDGIDDIPGTSDDGLRLALTSPAVDMGNNGADGLIGISDDFTGAQRVLGGTVDIGAYERAGIIIPDLDIYWLPEWRPVVQPCYTCPWAFLFFDGLFRNFVWDGPSQLIIDGDEAFVVGEIVDIRNSTIRFDVFLKLVEPKNWEQWSEEGGIYFALSPFAWRTARKNHEDWQYWTLSEESYLNGKGSLSGKISLRGKARKHKTGFQFGEGANALDRDLGLAGQFSYKGRLYFRGKKIKVSGKGMINVDAIPCGEDCSPLFEPEDLNLLALNVETNSLHNTPRDGKIHVYPNPASDMVMIALPESVEGQYTVLMYNDQGTMRLSERMSGSGKEIPLQLESLNPGLYYLQIVSEEGEVHNQRLIIR